MRRAWIFLLAPFLVFSLSFSACSKEEDIKPVKGRIEKLTEETATKAEKKIQTPIAKARATQSLGEERLNEMDGILQKQ